MANPQHIEWLLEGVEAWNARRERDDFVPDFEDTGVSLKELIREISNLEISRRFTLQGYNLSHADFRWAKLIGVNLQYANLQGADLTEARLSKADLRHANIQSCILEGVDFKHANLESAKMHGSYLEEANFQYTKLFDSSVFGSDLSYARNLTQSQLNSMNGDKDTLIPNTLGLPARWLENNIKHENYEIPMKPDAIPTGTKSAQTKHTTRLSPHIVANRQPIILSSLSVLEQIAVYRETVRGLNHLDAEFRERLLDFLDTLSENIRNLSESIPDNANDDSASEKTATWFESFREHLNINAAKYMEPESVAEATVPTGIILGCGAIGALVAGPIGFGAGSVFGQLITKNIKPGKASDTMQKLMSEDSDVPPE